MDSRRHRLSFTSSNATSSSSTPLGSSGLYGRSSLLSSDRYTRGTSVKLDLDRQAPRFHTSSRDTGIAESRHSSWKLPSSLTTPSASCDRPWASSSAGSRTKLGDSERRPGMYSGLLSTTQDSDYKRPKLSYINRASYSRGPSTPAVGSNYSCFDSSWKSPSTRSRSSSSSTTSEGLWARRDPEKRGESTYTPYADRATSSYAQGARPKETFYSSSRATGPVHHHRPSEYQSPLLSRDLCRTNPRTPVSASLRAQESAGAVPGPDPWSRPSRSRSWNAAAAAAPAANPSRGRSAESSDVDGRCTTRQLLSRLASSMSSSLFSRRSSQDSSSSSPASRSFESSEDASEGREAEESPPGRSGSPDTSERAGSNSPQGFAFLRRRRQGLPPLRETRRPPEADAGSWLSSSLRSRCPPLFSCRRREGRDETALSASRTSRCPLGRRDSAEGQEEEGQENDEDDDDDDDDEEEEATSEGAGVVGPSGATASTPANPGASRSGRIRLPAIPNSLFQLSVAPSLESARPETVSVSVDITAAGRNLPEGQKEKSASSRDPEKLRKIKESLLEESDEEEGDLCRICQMGEESASNPLIDPCRCTGSLQYVHQDCMKKWLRSKISSGSDLETIATCELCKEKLHLNIENFDINELYRTHERSEYEFISCGLYLVVLLHLCEQRFSDVLGAANDAGFFNLARTLHEHMDDLESSTGESDEEELQDNRPSIDFGDLDDEEY